MPLIKSTMDLIVTVDEKFYSFLVQMATSHQCTALALDISCVTNAYLNACVKASATSALSDPEEKIPALFQFIINDLEHRCYLGQPLPPSLWQLLLVL